MPKHRWSGWPGAWCLDCGTDDKGELCLADGHPLDCQRPECRNGPCPCPGEGHRDPYRRQPAESITEGE